MKALSIRQPYVSEILAGTKTREFRSWPTRYRGRFALHASKTPGEGLIPAGAVFGAIVGTAMLVACEEDCCGYAWVLADPQPLAVPIPWRGRVGWFTVEDLP